jgi:phage baseplate assembly protein W
MSGITPLLPLTIDGINGIRLITEYRELIKQNFKNLLLTVPGERVMDADFGVGLEQYLFELDNDMLRGRIRGRIEQQVSKYLPYIRIANISFESAQEDAVVDVNLLSVSVEYVIIPLDALDNLELTLPVD